MEHCHKSIWNNKSIKIEYESEKFLIVNKFYDLHINSDNPDVKVTIQTQLEYNFPHLVNDSLGHKFHFCHRLDYATSGLLCIAKTKDFAAEVAKAMQDRAVVKIYIALVRGVLQSQIMDIKYNIGEPKDPEEAKLKVYCDSGLKQRKSHTRVLLLQTGTYNGAPASKILLLAKTGRRHQLRAHLAQVGHVIVGDYTYSNREDTEPYRMMLHAYRLIIPTLDETADVVTDDPFREEIDDKLWVPSITYHKLDNTSINKLLNNNNTVR